MLDFEVTYLIEVRKFFREIDPQATKKKTVLETMRTISNEQILDEFIGEKGTPERKAFESELRADILACKFKKLRKKKQLTQKQLAEKAGMFPYFHAKA